MTIDFFLDKDEEDPLESWFNCEMPPSIGDLWCRKRVMDDKYRIVSRIWYAKTHIALIVEKL